MKSILAGAMLGICGLSSVVRSWMVWSSRSRCDSVPPGGTGAVFAASLVTSATRSPCRIARYPITPTANIASSLFTSPLVPSAAICLPVSTTINTVCLRAAMYRRISGVPWRAVAFQSMSRGSSPAT